MNRILVEAGEIGDDGMAILEGRRAAHIEKILCCGAGDTVRIGVIEGARGTAQVVTAGGGRVQIRCRLDDVPLPPTGVSLLLALPRPKVMRRLWAPLAALGVGRIVLTHAAKVERHYFDTHWLAPSVYRALLIEGLEQSGDTRLPVVHIHRRFKPLIEDEVRTIFGAARYIACDPCGTSPLATQLPTDDTPVVIAVGPEGGWTDYEMALMQAHGFECASFGARTLRTDTAVTAILGAVLAARSRTGIAIDRGA